MDAALHRAGRGRGARIVGAVACLIGASCGSPERATPSASASTTAPLALASSSAPTARASGSAHIEEPPARPPPFRSTERFTLKIEGGEVIDGEGAPRRRADVLVRGEEIAFVGDVDPSVVAETVLDARDAVVTPGFIDTHSHVDPAHVEVAIAQGVTLVVVGQDGLSPGDDVGTFLRGLDAKRPRVDVAALVGHTTVRGQAGAHGALDAAGRKKAADIVARAMADGAFGLSTGLEYDGGRDADMDELVALAEPVGRRGGVVMSHLRSEDDDRVEASLDELLEQCRRAGARAHVAHLKSVLGRGAARAKELLDRLATARATGLEVSADAYPYTASYTTLGILFPTWARPPHVYRAVLARRRGDLATYVHDLVEKRNGPSALLFGDGRYAGRTLADVADDGPTPFEDILLGLGPSGGSAAYFVMDDDLQSALLLDPDVAIGSDGGGGSAHPRGAGSFAKFIEEYVVTRRALPLEAAVRKMTAIPAHVLGLDGRAGCVRAGCAANVLVFEPSAVHARATYAEPRALAKGMRFVIVRGAIEIDHDRATRVHKGRALRSGP